MIFEKNNTEFLLTEHIENLVQQKTKPVRNLCF